MLRHTVRQDWSQDLNRTTPPPDPSRTTKRNELPARAKEQLRPVPHVRVFVGLQGCVEPWVFSDSI